MNKALLHGTATAGLAIAILLGCSSSPPVVDTTPADDFPNAVTGLVRGEGYAPVAGAAVYIRTNGYLSDTSIINEQPPQPDALTDSAGKYYIGSLANGEYVIEISTGATGIAVACTLASRSKHLTVLPDTALSPFGSIRGSVTFSGSRPVYARTYGLQRAARVDTVTGEYRITRVPQGTYSLQVMVPAPAVPSVDIANVKVYTSFLTVVDPVALQTFDQEDYGLWPYSRTVLLVTTPAGAGVADTLAGFPVLLRLTQSAIAFGQAAFDGRDIRFATAAGVHLRYQIERWDASGRSACVWVRADTVKGNDTTAIVMYWGKKNAADFSDGGQVFRREDGYMGVWHMADVSDASGQGHLLVTESAATTPSSDTGLAGGAMRFDGGNDFWLVPHSPGLDGNNRFSLSVWAQWLGAAVPGYNRIVSNKRVWDDSAGFEVLTISGNDSALDVRAEDSIGNGPLNVVGGWSAHGWHHITLVWDNGTCSIYVDGALVKAPLINAWDTPNDLVFGSNVGNTEQKWNGRLDEIRMSRGALSAGWIKLCYMNQKPLDALVRY
jgi:hypothetical protein